MSVNALIRICREVARDHAFRAVTKSDPAPAIAGYDLTPVERKALLAGDAVTLHSIGQRFHDGLSGPLRLLRP